MPNRLLPDVLNQVLSDLKSKVPRSDIEASLISHADLFTSKSNTQNKLLAERVLATACVEGAYAVYGRLCEYLRIDQVLIASHLSMACQSESVKMVEMVLSLSGSSPLDGGESFIRAIFSSGAPTAGPILKALFDDPRVRTRSLLGTAWRALGDQGQVSLIDSLATIHAGMPEERKSQDMLVSSWCCALARLIVGPDSTRPTRDLQDTVVQMWSLITPHDLCAYLLIQSARPEKQRNISFDLIDQRLTWLNPQLASAEGLSAAVIQQWVDLFFETCPAMMPAERSRRRAARAMVCPLVAGPGRSRSRP